MDLEVRDEIDRMTEHYREVMPPGIKELIGKLNADLYGGPSYYDADGDECTCFDEGAERFPFVAALAELREWIDDTISDVQMEVDYDPDTGESTYERVDGSAREITRRLVGRELAIMV
jgi:hypothetical protein